MRQKIREAVEERRLLLAAADEQLQEVYRLVDEARGVLGATELARETELSRQRIYQIWEAQEGLRAGQESRPSGER